MYIIEAEDTPNPFAKRFKINKPILDDDMGYDFPTQESARLSPLAMKLFSLGIGSVYIGNDFITIQIEDQNWHELIDPIIATIQEHLLSGEVIIIASENRNEEKDLSDYTDNDKEIIDQVISLIDEKIRPHVALDGGDIKFHKWDNASKTIFLSMQGACANCPSATFTLKSGVENLIKHYVPEVDFVEAI